MSERRAALEKATVRLCKECTHHRPNTYRVLFFKVRGDAAFDRCAMFPNPVTGEAKGFCDLERGFGSSKCGPDGKLWQTVPEKANHV